MAELSAWHDLIALLARPLDPADVRRVQARFDLELDRARQDGAGTLSGAAPSALLEALVEEAPPPPADGWWLCMQVDWKAWDEVEWQARRLARTHGLPGDFKLGPDVETVKVALAAFAAWLARFGATYQVWQLGEDAHYGFVLPEAAVPESGGWPNRPACRWAEPGPTSTQSSHLAQARSLGGPILAA